MTEIHIELARWGEHQAQRYVTPKASEDGPGPHPLSRARDFAPGTRERAARLLAGRDGRSRRLAMGAAAGTGISPQWASDPVPCKETRTPGPSMATFDRGLPPEYHWVEQALTRLQRVSPVQAAAVRIEFTVPASQGTKARLVSQETGVSVSKWQYRRVLALGMAYMAGRRA